MQRLALIGLDEQMANDLVSRLFRVELTSVDKAELVAVVGSVSQTSDAWSHDMKSGQAWLVAAEHCGTRTKFNAWITASRQADVSLTVSNRERSRPSRQLIEPQLNVGKLGLPVLVKSHRWSRSMDRHFAAGVLPVACLQDLDIAMWLMSSRPTTIFATATSASSATASCVVHCGFSDNGMTQSEFTLSPSVCETSYGALTVLGASGACYSDDSANQQLRLRGSAIESFSSGEGCRTLVNLVQRFCDDARDDVDWAASLQAWSDVLTLNDLIQRSLISQRAVRWEDC